MESKGSLENVWKIYDACLFVFIFAPQYFCCLSFYLSISLPLFFAFSISVFLPCKLCFVFWINNLDELSLHATNTFAFHLFNFLFKFIFHFPRFSLSKSRVYFHWHKNVAQFKTCKTWQSLIIYFIFDLTILSYYYTKSKSRAHFYLWL